MNSLTIFILSTAVSALSSALVARLYVWPWLQARARNQALVSLVAPHMFLRFVGLSVLVPGVVSPALSPAWALPAAYGDFGAGVLAIIAVMAIAARSSFATPAVWVFNIWGTADFLFAFFQGPLVQLDPGTLGAAFYIPTAIVPPLFVSHVLVFGLLIQAWRAARSMEAKTARRDNAYESA